MSIKKISLLLISASLFLVSCGGGGGGTAASGGYGSSGSGSSGSGSSGSSGSSCSSDYCITVVSTASGNKYAVNGSTQGAITITAGQTKTFDLSDSSLSGHPFALSKRADGRNAGTVVSADTLGASDGVTTASNVLTIVSSSSTSTPLYYYCTNHAGMGGTITVSGGTSTGYEVHGKVQPIDT